MTRLEDLLHSLTTFLVRFHDSQPKILSKLVSESEQNNTRSIAIKILRDTSEGNGTRLKQIVKICNTVYPERTPLLNFVLNQINYLKDMLDRKKSLSDEELARCTMQVSQMLIDFKQLLLTRKNKTYKVTHSRIINDMDPSNDAPISLIGLVNDAYVGNHYCNSGTLLISEVLARLQINVSETSNEKISDIADALCNEHNNALLASEYKAEKLLRLQTKPVIIDIDEEERSKTILDLTKKLESAIRIKQEQGNTILDLSTKLETTESKAKNQDNTILDLTSKLEAADSNTQELDQTILDLMNKLKLADNKTQEQDKTILDLTTRLKSADSKTQQHDETILDLTTKIKLADNNAQEQNKTILDLTNKLKLAENKVREQESTILDLTSKLLAVESRSKNKNEMQSIAPKQPETTTKNPKPLPLGLNYASLFGLASPIQQGGQPQSPSEKTLGV